MTTNNIIKTKIAIILIDTRINELERSKIYYNTPSVYRTRLRNLREEKEQLEDLLEGRKVSAKKAERIVFELNVPNNAFKSETPDTDEILQYFKRENITLVG